MEKNRLEKKLAIQRIRQGPGRRKQSGLKPFTDTAARDSAGRDRVGGRAACAEAGARVPVERVAMKILVLVATIPGENPGRRKGKSFSFTKENLGKEKLPKGFLATLANFSF